VQTDAPPPGEAPIQSATSTAVQAGAPGETKDEVIPLPPLKVKRAPLTPERLAAEIRVLDRIVVGLVILLTFFLASFAVQNSDFWMPLATGRLLAEGQYSFGVNPFSNPETVYWANQAWLFDLILYLLSSLAGGVDAPAAGAVLVVFKALLIMGLAWLMLKTRRPGQSLWVPALCTGLAVLVMSPRLVLQPVICSYLFLGLTIYLLSGEN